MNECTYECMNECTYEWTSKWNKKSTSVSLTLHRLGRENDSFTLPILPGIHYFSHTTLTLRWGEYRGQPPGTYCPGEWVVSWPWVPSCVAWSTWWGTEYNWSLCSHETPPHSAPPLPYAHIYTQTYTNKHVRHEPLYNHNRIRIITMHGWIIKNNKFARTLIPLPPVSIEEHGTSATPEVLGKRPA